MSKIWKPTQAQCDLIKRAAAKEGNVPLKAVLLEPGLRWNTDDGSKPQSINIALVSDEAEWGDTDLADMGYWEAFRKGVELTEDGRAIVDFYIRKRGDEWAELYGNVTAYYEGGHIVRIHGYPGEYQAEEKTNG